MLGHATKKFPPSSDIVPPLQSSTEFVAFLFLVVQAEILALLGYT